MTLKERRKALGLTQEDVERSTGIDQTSICAYEKGKWKPRFEMAKALANLYGCTVAEIMESCREGSGNNA